MRKLRPTLIAIAVAVGIAGTTGVEAAPTYTVESQFDPATGNTEIRMFSDSFHYGSLIRDSAGRVAFRAHPHLDPNGWGTTYYPAPFVAGTDSRNSVIQSVASNTIGIAVSLNGPVARTSTQDFGSWSFAATFEYDAGLQRVYATGNMTLSLGGLLTEGGRDLNLGRLASNFLWDVPLQGGGIGSTGDMKSASVSYATNGSPLNFTWYPNVESAHFPVDASRFLSVVVVGDVNRVDTQALGEGFQIAVAAKPTVAVSFETVNADPLGIGLAWDPTLGQRFESDNVGISPLLLVGQNTLIDQHYLVTFSAVAPVPEAHTWIMTLAGMSLLALWTRRKNTGC